MAVNIALREPILFAIGMDKFWPIQVKRVIRGPIMLRSSERRFEKPLWRK